MPSIEPENPDARAATTHLQGRFMFFRSMTEHLKDEWVSFDAKKDIVDHFDIMNSLTRFGDLRMAKLPIDTMTLLYAMNARDRFLRQIEISLDKVMVVLHLRL